MLKNAVPLTDGIAKIYTPVNTAARGDRANEEPQNERIARYRTKTVGFDRFYTALDHKNKIAKVIMIPAGVPAKPNDVVILEDSKTDRYVITQVQELNDKRPRILQLSLQRVEK